jgi:poly-gamma-glutamate capsule biosynthesis protein CapA/YwtB (metallophosphatase superfamily)
MPDIVKTLIGIYARLHKEEFKYPLQIEENLEHFSLRELMWTGYKMLLKHPIEWGEKEKHLEEYFAAQDLEFPLAEGFTESSELSLSAGGDLLSSRDANLSNTTKLWDEAEDFLFSADICCANLETPVVPTRAATFLPVKMSTKIALNNSPEMFDVFWRGGSGVNVFSTANNHSLDMGEDGLMETLEFLNKKGCTHVGTSASDAERENFPIIEKNGVRVAFLSYTYALNGKKRPEGKDYLVNYIRLNKPDSDLSMIARHVRKAKLEKGADIVIACLHWSVEFESYPLKSLIETGHKIMDMGVDVIIGNHAHGIQPLEKYTYIDPFSGLKKEGLIAYALGDLLSCTEKDEECTPNARINDLLRLKISKGSLNGSPAAIISDLKIRPMYFRTKMENGFCTDYRLLNLKKLLVELDMGINRTNLSKAEITEAQRLGSLAKKILHWEITA